MDFNINPLHSPNYHIANTRPVLGSTLKLQRVQWNGWPRIKKKIKLPSGKKGGPMARDETLSTRATCDATTALAQGPRRQTCDVHQKIQGALQD